MNDVFSARLPFPISTNDAWRTYNGRVILSARAREWRLTALNVLDGCPVVPTFTEPVEAILRIRRNYTAKCRKWDLDNYVKIVLDALTTFGVWEDDELVHKLILTKESNKVPSIKEHGRGEVLVVVRSVGDMQ